MTPPELRRPSSSFARWALAGWIVAFTTGCAGDGTPAGAGAQDAVVAPTEDTSHPHDEGGIDGHGPDAHRGDDGIPSRDTSAPPTDTGDGGTSHDGGQDDAADPRDVPDRDLDDGTAGSGDDTGDAITSDEGQAGSDARDGAADDGADGPDVADDIAPADVPADGHDATGDDDGVGTEDGGDDAGGDVVGDVEPADVPADGRDGAGDDDGIGGDDDAGGGDGSDSDSDDGGVPHCGPTPPFCAEQQGVCGGVMVPGDGCVDGTWRACTAPDYAAARPAYQTGQETRCDGLDNDCDGAVDEGLAGCDCPDGRCNLLRRPYLQVVTPTSATVVWRTPAGGPTDSRVRFGQEALEAVAQGAAVTPAGNPGALDHVVTIRGLRPATTYRYDVGTITGGAITPAAAGDTFRTAPPVGDPVPFRAWFIGDSGTGGSKQVAVRDALYAHDTATPPELFCHVGDMAYDDGTDREFTEHHFDIYADVLRHTAHWPAIGNHEARTSSSPGGSGPYYEAYVLPTAGEAGGEPSGTEAYYAFDYGNAHFIVLDTADSSIQPGSAQLRWLAADLASTTQHWVVAYFHHPPYTKGSHDSDSTGDSGGRLVDAREHILPILEAGGTDLVIAGHSHIYERSYLIDGAYGYGSTTPPFERLDADGRILDAGDGDPNGDGAYVKGPGIAAHDGAVYVVAGHGGSSLRGSADHPVMAVSELANGAVILSFDGPAMTARNLRADGQITDAFRLYKAPARCDTAADCDDGDGCTRTRCEAASCVVEPVRCGDGERCDPGTGACEAYVPPVVVRLRQGSEAYSSCVDTSLLSGAADTPQSGAADLLWDTSSYKAGLIRFGGIFASEGGPVPDGASIERALLHLTSFDEGDHANLHEVVTPWDHTTTYDGFGGEAGVQAADYGDHVTLAPGVVGPISLDVTPSLQRWSHDPSSNGGWIFVPTGSNGVDLRSCDSGTASERPTLEIHYVPAADR